MNKNKGRPRVELTPIHDISINWDYYQRHQVPDANEQGCTHWNAGRHRQGYGMTHAVRHADGEAIMVTTHRVAARIKYDRPISSREWVVHTCSNMACMNPAHLEIGDRRTMNEIMIQNNRHRYGTAPRSPGLDEIVAPLSTAELQRQLGMSLQETSRDLDISENRAKYWRKAARQELAKRKP